MQSEGKDRLLFEVPLSAALPDLDALRRSRVPGAEKVVLPGRDEDLSVQLGRLEREFAGEPQIELFHAVLNMLVRRRLQASEAYRQFETLWREHGDYLLAKLSARWLISACDTIMDCAKDGRERAIACVGATLMNTIKLYETERLGNGPPRATLQELPDPIPLFDGMTSFAVGGGDMIYNLRRRVKALCEEGGIASRIVLELLRRADRNDTIYRRLAAVHRVHETRW
jgi:hypothetical protein